VTNLKQAAITGELAVWNDEKLIVVTDKPQSMDRLETRLVTFDRLAAKSSPGQSILWLSNGDRIVARVAKVANDQVTVNWPIAGDSPPRIPLEKVVAIILDLPASANDRLRLYSDLETLPAGNDLVILANGDRTQGEFLELDDAIIELKVAGKPLKLDRARARALRMNSQLTNSSKIVRHRQIFTLTDGSRVTSTSCDLVDGILKLKSTEVGMLRIPLSTVVSCQLFGDRLVPLSDYEPAKAEFTPYFSNHWPLVRNANVMHGKLGLRGAEFATGLGMHSQMRVTYALRGSEQSFQSVVGIDDIAGGRGSVQFGVEVDGRRVWKSSELTGKSAPLTIPPVSLRGAKQLTLIVEFGQFADVADYADWCDAVLLLDSVP